MKVFLWRTGDMNVFFGASHLYTYKVGPYDH